MGFNLHAENYDPPEVRNWRVHLMATIVCMASLAMGYDTAVIGGTMALDSFKRDFDLTEGTQSRLDTLQGNIVSTFQAGTVIGVLFTSPIAEKFGRKIAIIFSTVIFLIGGVFMVSSNGSLGLIYAGRAIAGFGVGGVSLIVPVYVAETSPPSIRGRLVGIFEILAQSGGMFGFWINYIVNRTISSDTKTQWLIPLGLQLLPGCLLLCGIFWCPETPRWYAKYDRWEEATGTLSWIRKLPVDNEYVKWELEEIRIQVETQVSSRNLPPGIKTKIKYYISRLLQPGTRNRIGIGLLLMTFQNFAGVTVITYYSPRIFETLGVQGTDTKLFATGFYGVAKTLGVVIFSVWLVEKVGRRQGLIWGAFVGSLPMWYLAGMYSRPTRRLQVARVTYEADGVTWLWSVLTSTV
ncbi:hypothetical protein TWF481_003999 [Arthrobotrys musiformis]|uniref:Major facilitator superfamily (MFS) profile domain-containing protein n=1 Tax=Arthrobotrys musiformis TaxID=47236 RepID=A0AAV9WJB9_9PEZI